MVNSRALCTVRHPSRNDTPVAAASCAQARSTYYASSMPTACGATPKHCRRTTDAAAPHPRQHCLTCTEVPACIGCPHSCFPQVLHAFLFKAVARQRAAAHTAVWYHFCPAELAAASARMQALKDSTHNPPYMNPSIPRSPTGGLAPPKPLPAPAHASALPPPDNASQPEYCIHTRNTDTALSMTAQKAAQLERHPVFTVLKTVKTRSNITWGAGRYTGHSYVQNRGAAATPLPVGVPRARPCSQWCTAARGSADQAVKLTP